MQTLTYGLKKPQTGDLGPEVFPALEANITQLDAHNHDGANSPLLNPKNILGTTQSILAASWVSTGSAGEYRQLVTVPTGFLFDRVQISFRTSAGSYVYPTVEKVSSTTYYVYTNDNTLALTAVYGG